MGRKPRMGLPGTIHHVMARGNGGADIFEIDEDRHAFIEILAHLKEVCGFELFSLCLMSNHFHLLLRLEEVSLSRIMLRLQGAYARRFNKRRRTRGHVFQARFKSILCLNDSYLLELLRYIDLNPVRAGWVSDPIDWLWSTHAAYVRGESRIGIEPDCRFPLGMFSDDTPTARVRYRKFVLANHDRNFDPFQEARGVHPLRTLQIPKRPARPLVQSLDAVASALLARCRGISLADLTGPRRQRELSVLRKRFILGAIEGGNPAAEIARYLNRSHSWVIAVEQAALKEGRN